MTTSPISREPQPGPQPRDRDGRFGPVPLSAVELDLVPPPHLADQVDWPTPTGAWPTADTDPAEAQAMLHDIVWDANRPETERALAARGAIACARELGDGAVPGLPPGDEADGYLAEAVTSHDVVLDAAHELGPLPYPTSRNFGAELAGRIYDTVTTRRDQLLATSERFLADQVLPPESEASRRAADDGRIDPQPEAEWCRSCTGYGFHPKQDPQDGAIEPEPCRDCFGLGREVLTPLR